MKLMKCNEYQVNAGDTSCHDDVIKWKHFPRYWTFVWGIHWSPVHSPHKGHWRGVLIFSISPRLNQHLRKHWRLRWFETPSPSLWRNCNAICCATVAIVSTSVIFTQIYIVVGTPHFSVQTLTLLHGLRIKRTLQWRHNERDCVLKAPALQIFTQLFIGADKRKHQSSASLTDEFLAQGPITRKKVSIWWRHKWFASK